jgi:alpha-beta hydrolase superfamily lysophospholipase
MSTTEFTRAADGTSLLRRSWESESPRAAILITHGLGEHSGRYEHLGTRLSESGYAVRAIDHRGFGRSGGHRAFVERFDVYLDDLEPEVADLRSGGLPVVLYGHSLGGLIALAYTLGDRTRPDLLVLSAPAVAADIPASKRLAARVLGRVLPRLMIPNGLTGDQLSRDPAVGEAYFADPLVITKSTTRLGAEGFRVMDETAERVAAGIPVPTLVVHGGADPIVPPAASEPLGHLPGVERVVFPDFRHESHHEDGGEALVAAVTGWLDRQLG